MSRSQLLKSNHKGKGKVHPTTGPEVEYSYTLSLTSALGEMGGQGHAPAVLPPGKARYPLYRRVGGPQGRSGRGRKNLTPTGIRSPDCPARSQSLYRLRYPGPPKFKSDFFILVNNCALYKQLVMIQITGQI